VIEKRLRQPSDSSPAQPEPARIPYAPPALEKLGDLRSRVLGATVGTQDSGNITGFTGP
jgi:hypothetical protein